METCGYSATNLAANGSNANRYTSTVGLCTAGTCTSSFQDIKEASSVAKKVRRRIG